jgi:PadR family transcriptional regulator AphA
MSNRSPEYALLGFLYEQPYHGYELHQRLTAELGSIWHASQSQTYNILKRLERQGFIQATTVEQEKLPPRQVLHITPTGKRRFKTWLRTPTGSTVRAIRVDFITRLYFARHLGKEEVQAMLETQAAAVQDDLRQLESILADMPNERLYNRLGLELRIHQLNSILSWLMECRSIILP